MRCYLYLLIVFLGAAAWLEAQEHQRYWIFLTDPDDQYIESIRSVTDSITVRSRWLDAVSVPATTAQLNLIRSFPFVKSIQPVARMNRPQPVPEPATPDDHLQQHLEPMDEYYGFSDTQIKMHDIHTLHRAGIDGSGVTIGFLDTGYRWEQHAALGGAQVIAERDFVAEYYPGDELPASHYDHGTWVFSVVAGYEPGSFIGVAPRARFLLGATEDIRTETPIEEDFWVAGIEWMGEMGVDIVSTSLGYSTFDPPYDSYTPEDMDGKTAVTTITADHAFERGILVVASAGNSGNSPWRIITSPADGEYVIAAGAVHDDGRIANFSSRGPSADGRIKPDVSALGVGVAAAQAAPSGYRSFSGTSFSAPIVSGTAGLILAARPDLNAAELRNALLYSARRNGEPDNTFGYGLLDAPAALAFPALRVLADGSRAFTTSLVAQDGIVEESVTLHLRTTNDPDYTTNPFMLIEPFHTATSGLYRSILDHMYDGESLHFVITAEDSVGNRIRYPAGSSNEFYLSPVQDLITVTERIIPERFVLHQNYPNPFNNRTVIRFELPSDDRVTITVYDILGRQVVSLADEFYLAGVHEVSWQPAAQASGTYFYTIRYGGQTDVGRMVYIR